MRTLAPVAVVVAALTVAARAEPDGPPGAPITQSTTIGGVRIDLALKPPATLSTGPGGAVVAAPGMPSIWFGASDAPCPPPSVLDEQDLDLPRPTGLHVAPAPPTPRPSPWPQRLSWRAMCVEGDGVTLDVLVQYFDHIANQPAHLHVQDVLQKLVKAIRPPLEIAPRVSFDRTAWGALLRRGAAPGQLLFEDKLLEVSLDHVSCFALPALPPGTLHECSELPDRAVVVSYRTVPRPAGEPAPPPPEPTPPGEAVPPPPRAVQAEDADAPPPPPPPGGPPPPGDPAQPAPAASAPAPRPRPPDIVNLARAITGTVVIAYGFATWVQDDTFSPSWANGALAIGRLPAGKWKLSDRGATFELFDILSRAHIVVTRTPCDGFWAAPPAGRRIEAPGFLPRAARAAVVDERERWRGAACFPLLGVDVAVTIDLPRAPDPATARALAGALTEELNALRMSGSISAAVGRGALGVFFEGWLVSRLSAVAQLEVIDPGTDTKGKLESIRFGVGLGPGFSRPRLRAAIHAGFAFELPAMKERDGEDHAGGALFLDARALAGVGPFMVQGIARGAYYFDIDCTDSNDSDQLCGESDPSDHTPRLGWELEGRAGITPRREGWMFGGYLGLRYFAVWTGDRVEHGAVGTLGGTIW